MKRSIVLLIIACVAVTSSADLTDFHWEGGTLRDNGGATIAYGDSLILTFVSDDANIDFNSGIALSDTYGDDVLVYDQYTVGPPPAPGQFNTNPIIEPNGGNDYRGKYVYSVAFDMVHATYTGIGSIAEGTYYGIGAMSSSALADMDKDPRPTADAFNPGAVQTTIQTIPEPAVASLLVVFGGGLMFAKRRFAKA